MWDVHSLCDRNYVRCTLTVWQEVCQMYTDCVTGSMLDVFWLCDRKCVRCTLTVWLWWQVFGERYIFWQGGHLFLIFLRSVLMVSKMAVYCISSYVMQPLAHLLNLCFFVQHNFYNIFYLLSKTYLWDVSAYRTCISLYDIYVWLLKLTFNALHSVWRGATHVVLVYDCLSVMLLC